MNIRKSTTAIFAATILLFSPVTAQIKLLPDGSAIRVVGGSPGNTVAILAGLEQIHAPLPGGAVLRVNPLLILAIAKFDADGEYRHEFNIGTDVLLPPLRALVQAVTTIHDSNTFATTGLVEVRYDGAGKFTTTDYEALLTQVLLPPTSHALRYRAVA